jgi:hypothetical protein
MGAHPPCAAIMSKADFLLMIRPDKAGGWNGYSGYRKVIHFDELAPAKEWLRRARAVRAGNSARVQDEIRAKKDS